MYVQPVMQPPSLISVHEDVEVEGIIQMFVCTTDQPVLVWFGVVENVSVVLLVRTLSIDSFIECILPMELKIVPRHLNLPPA